MKRACAAVVPLSLAVLVSLATGATSSPATGDWSGKFKGVSPKLGVTFSVATKGSSRRVTGFAANGSAKVPCGFKGETTGVGGIPDAKVNSAGKFKAIVSARVNAGKDTITVSGTFTGKRAATGTVVLDASGDAGHACKFALKWTAAEEPPAPPVRGASYRGATTKDQAGGGSPVTFHVSAKGSKLTQVKFTAPAPFHCSGAASGAIVVTGHNVPIRHERFSFTQQQGNSAFKSYYTITGQFLSGQRAAGMVLLEERTHFGSTRSKCVDSNTWTAHA